METHPFSPSNVFHLFLLFWLTEGHIEGNWAEEAISYNVFQKTHPLGLRGGHDIIYTISSYEIA